MTAQAGEDIRQLAAFILRHKIIPVLGALVGLILIGIIRFFFPSDYTAIVQIRISTRTPLQEKSSPTLSLEELNAAKTRAATCAEILKSPGFYQSVILNHSLSDTVEQLQRKIEIVHKTDTEIISLKITSNTSEDAGSLASKVELEAPKFLSKTLRTGSANLITSNIITQTDTPSNAALITMGIFFGAASSTICLILFKMSTDLVISGDDLIMQYKSPVLAEIPDKAPFRQQAVENCNQILRHLIKPTDGPSIIRMIGLGKVNDFSLFCDELAESASKISSILFIDTGAALEVSPSKVNNKPNVQNPNLNIRTASFENLSDILSKSQMEFPQILIKDLFEQRIFHASPLQPLEHIVLVVQRDWAFHSHVRRCLEMVHLLHLPFIGFILLE